MIESADVLKCYLCGSEGNALYTKLSDRFFGIDGSWSLYRCSNHECGLCWLNPKPLEKEIPRLYADYMTHESTNRNRSFAASEKLIDRIFCHKYTPHKVKLSVSESMLLHFPPYMEMVNALTLWSNRSEGKKVLDIGCGDGELLERFRYIGWDVAGVEIDPVSRRIAIEKGIHLFENGLLEIETGCHKFDLITMSHVIEHLPDPLEYIVKSRDLLNSDGELVILTPNISSLCHRNFREYWVDLDPPRHLFHFSATSLSQLLKKAGFTINELRTTARMASPRWRASSLLKKQGTIPGYTMPQEPGHKKITGIFFQLIEHLAAQHYNVGEEIMLKARKI